MDSFQKLYRLVSGTWGLKEGIKIGPQFLNLDFHRVKFEIPIFELWSQVEEVLYVNQAQLGVVFILNNLAFSRNQLLEILLFENELGLFFKLAEEDDHFFNVDDILGYISEGPLAILRRLIEQPFQGHTDHFLIGHIFQNCDDLLTGLLPLRLTIPTR